MIIRTERKHIKYHQNILIIALAVALSLLVILSMPVSPTLAQQAITLSPVSGFLGDEVTVTGTGFHSGQNTYVDLYFGDFQIKSIRVPEGGTFTTDFNVPGYVMPGTSYSVSIRDKDGVILAEKSFIVGAKITLEPNEGNIGKGITVSGRYFDANKEIRLYFSSDTANIGDNIDDEVTAYKYLGKVSTNTEGYLNSPSNFAVPGQLSDGADKENVHSGDYYVYAIDFSAGKRIRAAARFVVTSSATDLKVITLSPISGFFGTTVTVTGTGFHSGQDTYVDLYFGNFKIKSIGVPEGGTFTTDFNVPGYVMPGTSYSVSIRDEDDIILVQKSFIVTAELSSSADKIEVGKGITVDGRYFDANKEIRLYFSGDIANIGDDIDGEVTAYKYLGKVFTNSEGYFGNRFNFSVPGQLSDGADTENVHRGDYYIYATYLSGGNSIKASARFSVIGIELYPDGGPVGTQVKISGEDLRSNGKITVTYDGVNIAITSGDDTTDTDGRLACVVTTPKSVVGDHTIAVKVGYGTQYTALFNVNPRITIAPTLAAAGEKVHFYGTGFGAPYYESDRVVISFEGNEIPADPPVRTDSKGSFSGNFTVPSDANGGVYTVTAIDTNLNRAETQLTINNAPPASASNAGVTLQPATSHESPGHVGMNITATGKGFEANTAVTITYGNIRPITVATTTTDGNGNFSATFSTPATPAGDHNVTCTDGTNNPSSTFVMESAAPAAPTHLVSLFDTTPETKVHFDWEDIKDISGVAYVLQVASDPDFETIVLENTGLTSSEYALTEEAGIGTNGEEATYYWRIKAVDGASNNSRWAFYRSLYFGPSQAESLFTMIPTWVYGVAIGLVLAGLLVTIYIFVKNS